MGGTGSVALRAAQEETVAAVDCSPAMGAMAVRAARHRPVTVERAATAAPLVSFLCRGPAAPEVTAAPEAWGFPARLDPGLAGQELRGLRVA